MNDVGFEAGGPIVQNRAFWFAALNPQWERETVHGAADLPAVHASAKFRATAARITYSAKGTFQIAARPPH